MKKAQKFNRRMMWSMLGMAVVLFAVVFAMFYYAFKNKKIDAPSAQGDSIVVTIE